MARWWSLPFIAIWYLTLVSANVASLLEEEGRPHHVLYSDDFAEESWKDYSWNARLVDFQSYPGHESSAAIDVDIEGWGAFALSKVKLNNNLPQVST